MYNSSIVRSEVTETRFGMYTDAELREMSVCKVTSPLARDALGNPLSGGLYDSRMGATEAGQNCPTCGIHHVGCPGHPGHIELDFPVYHPLLFLDLFQLVRSACFCCHKFRMSGNRIWAYLAKLQLLEMDDVAGAESLDDRLLPGSLVGDIDGEDDAEDAENKKSSVKITLAKQKAEKQKTALARMEVLEEVDQRFRAFKRAANGANARPPSVHTKQKQRAVIAELVKELASTKKCVSCGEWSPTVRKDGYAKLFAKSLPKKYRRRAVRNRHLYGNRTALEEVRYIEERESRREQRKAQGLDSVDEVDDDDDDDDEMDVDATLDALDEEEEEADVRDEGEGGDSSAADADKYLVPLETEAILRLLWLHHADILDFVWGRSLSRSSREEKKAVSNGWRTFFMRCVLVTPNRFRPEAHIGDAVSDHPQNKNLAKIIESNDAIADLARKHNGSSAEATEQSSGGSLRNLIASGSPNRNTSAKVAAPVSQSGKVERSFLSQSVLLWTQLQNSVNCYMDSAKDPNPLSNTGPAGIRQLLEKKEGLFRMNMMGKRVNYCCRSVISPDPYIGQNEIGIPVRFAKTLHYPTPVNEWNAKHLRTLVERGPDQYPGANQIETYDGKIIKLDRLTPAERVAKAKLLLATPGNKVYRHLVNGDSLLVNRQPSLHKPSIMAHKARVLTHVPEQTIRMHYANCSSYNADFDGDEMNAHFVQALTLALFKMKNELARAESQHIMNCDNQYIVPTSGNPLRGLIQDHVASGVKLTCKETFLSKADFMQLVHIATSGLEGTEVVQFSENVILPAPAIIKPKELWTGKQVISALLDNLIRAPLPPIHLDGKTRTPPTAFGADQEEHLVLFRSNHLLRGVLDKASMGSSTMGIVHAVYELYGADMAGTLLHAFGCLFTYYLQDAGHTCGLQDLVLTEAAERQRDSLLNRVKMDASVGLKAFVGGENVQETVKKASTSGEDSYGVTGADMAEVESGLADMAARRGKDAKIAVDAAMQSVVNKSASDVIKACTPNGLYAPFLQNSFSMMVMTGAKGSSVNQSSISCMLGQQALEGQRVPLMVSGKSLPSFKAYDGQPRAHGFVGDRFLTGVKPQEYYFHCMAGREGLVDTAVKTSRSGYLQRCLVKHLEELKVNYDNTVRDAGGNVIQFLYGDDGIDPCGSALLKGTSAQISFLAQNFNALLHKYAIKPELFAEGGLDHERAKAHNTQMHYARKHSAAMGSRRDSSMATKKQLSKAVVQARRRRAPIGWSRGNIKSTWEAASVTKVHVDDRKEPVCVDLKYHKDGKEDKKVPLFINEEVKSQGTGLCGDMQGPVTSKQKIPLIRAGLPDTTLSTLPLSTCLGACSEKLQAAIDEYCDQNNDHQVNGEQLEMLLWMKYLKALASPGEAVGCVAAQSVGEPSTQMTLNTFHLAGSGANVTMGIPRVREIVMTASRVLKTPTMKIPLQPELTTGDCRGLALQLSALKLSQLLHHENAITVGERVHRIGGTGPWTRSYRIRLQLQPLDRIQSAFGLTFEDISECVGKLFRTSLSRRVKIEQRRAKQQESVQGAAIKSDKVPSSHSELEDLDGLFSSDEEDASDKESDAEPTKDDGATDRDISEDSDSDISVRASASVIKRRAAVDSDSSSGSDSDSDSDVDDTATHPASRGATDVDEDDVQNKDQRVSFSDAKEGVGMKKHAATRSMNGADTPTSHRDGLVCSEDAGWIELAIDLPARSRRLLMTQVAESIAEATPIRHTKNINQCYATTMDLAPGKEVPAVQTEGVNFEAIWELSPLIIDHNAIQSNDIWQILCHYGVEAARESISYEITSVFGAYGININARHLSLIADFMTRNGSYVPMNRQGMNESTSPFVQMSFETTCNFLTRAAQEGLSDNQESPTARIVLGQPMKHGTGAFSIMTPMEKAQ